MIMGWIGAGMGFVLLMLYLFAVIDRNRTGKGVWYTYRQVDYWKYREPKIYKKLNGDKRDWRTDI